MKIKIPERGDILICNLSPTLGHEQNGNRPVLVISSSEFNIKTGLILICPITNTKRDYFFEVSVQTNKTSGVILTHQVKTIDFRARKIRIVDKADKAVLKEVTEKINVLIEG